MKRVIYKLEFSEGQHDWEWLETSDNKGKLIEWMQAAERIKRENVYFRIIEEITTIRVVE